MVTETQPAPPQTYSVSVKKFVDFSCRSGDLVHTGPAGPTALEGQAAHRKLQKQCKPTEQSEVKVSTAITIEEQTLKLGGRVDLLNMPEDISETPVVSEIKSCYAPPDKQPASTVELHWAQTKVYGYCVLSDRLLKLDKQLQTQAQDQQQDVETRDVETRDTDSYPNSATTVDTSHASIELRLIWVNLQTDETTVDSRRYHYKELKQFVYSAAKKYLEWMQLLTTCKQRTHLSAKSLDFPHDSFREGQRKMAASVYVSTRDKKYLLCEAPTGVGKTVSTLFPAIKAIGETLVESVVYLTAKNSGRESANTCLSQLRSAGLSITAITITAKKTTCHCSNGSCERDPDGRCPLTIGFFDRLPPARTELLNKGIVSPADLDTMAHKYQLCPFELTLQMLPWVSVVICDYNYVFDPLVRLTHFSENGKKQLLLVDEAHNLAERARSMYSAQLVKVDIKAAIKECAAQPVIAKELTRVVRAMDRWAKETETDESAVCTAPATITRAVNKCADALSALTENNVALSEKTIDVAKELYRYRVIEDIYGDQHRTITIKSTAGRKAGEYFGQSILSRKRSGNLKVQLRCLNATHALGHSFKQFRSATAFSATLRPQRVARDNLGLATDTYCVSLDSPFPPENQGTFLCSWIDTRYRARESSIAPLANIAHQIYNAKRGNYQIFFPSYAFMETVHSAFCKLYPTVPTIIQQRDANEQTRQQFLSSFESKTATLAFAILGGIYGEGIDYRGDKLIGAIVVGTGLPSMSLEQKLIEQDYNRQGLSGFDYASRYPGMTRVLQTAGRVIRSEKDKGIVVLVDQRLTEPFYQPLFPTHWQIQQCSNPSNFQQQVEQFWADK